MTTAELLARHSVLAADTVAFIYYLEDRRPWADRLQPLFEAWQAGSHQGVASTITLLELMVQPLRVGRSDAARNYRTSLESFPNLRLLPLDPDVAERASRLRADLNLSTPDAIHVASALLGGASVLVTNDHGLRRVPDLEVVLLDDLQP